MRLQFLVLLVLFFSLGIINAQEIDSKTFRNYDYIYKKHIKSVQFYPFESEIDYPILSLHSPGHFVLSFDDMEAYTKDFSYKIIHCNANWEPTLELDPIDYIDGFQENRFYESQNSFSTKVPYTHYEVKIPNEDIKWTKSGNYLLKVYRDNDENDLIITRRFMIVDTKIKVVPQLRRSATPPNALSHQELFFVIEHAGFKIGNVNEQIQTAILQNGRWNNSIINLQPTYIKDEEIGYNMHGKLIFPGYKEFRPLDIRSFRFRTLQVEQLQEYNNGFELWLFEDVNRQHIAHLFTHDLNGNFLIETHDERDATLEGEYGDINFSLKALTPYNGDVYLLGGFNNFQPKEEFKMTYNDNRRGYQLTTKLKNGFYDYIYGLAEKNSNKINFKILEGSSFETENDYLFLVYFKEFGGLYDQLVAYQKFNTRPN
ncbi:MAG: DUF5103 domain-containing protein [Saprospiraceae bacterium]|nr:DUF5103 domain-containing protein [Saprospiraceae bacterium]